MKALRPVYAGTYDGGVFAMTSFGKLEATRVETEQIGGAVFPPNVYAI